MTTGTTHRRRRSLDELQRRTSGAHELAGVLGPSTTIDRSRWFVCPTLTPLYYTPVYGELSDAQQRRYNQLTGMCFNELIALFEQTFAGALRSLVGRAERDGDQALARCLAEFLDDEREHIAYWHALNRHTEPDWYAQREQAITHTPALARRALGCVAARPARVSATLWLMLALEEHSIELARRSLRLDPMIAEPTYRAAYYHHTADEVRHVQLDCLLIERYHTPMPHRRRAANAWLLAQLIGRCFLPPTRAAMRVVDRLVREHGELAGLRPTMRRQLRALGHDPDYHAMMYSREATPLLFEMFDRHPEMHRMRHVLLCYSP